MLILMKNMDKNDISELNSDSYLPFYLYFLHIVKNYEGSEILVYFQANKLACHNLMNTGRKIKIPG